MQFNHIVATIAALAVGSTLAAPAAMPAAEAKVIHLQLDFHDVIRLTAHSSACGCTRSRRGTRHCSQTILPRWICRWLLLSQWILLLPEILLPNQRLLPEQRVVVQQQPSLP